MRNPKRIKNFCDELAKIWESNVPDWRFGQLMMNVLGEMARDGRDPFFPEDQELIDYLKKYFQVEEPNENENT